MSFLAPLFLLGTAAIALPVVFHLIRRSPRAQRLFSSLMFLSPSTPRLTRRSRPEHLLLLLLRCAVLCLLALAFARPFWRQSLPNPPSGEPVKKSVLLLDISASMQRAGLWQAAQQRFEAFVAQADPSDQVAVMAFDDHLTPLVTFDEWNATPPEDRRAWVRSRLADVQPGWGGTALDQAVIRSTELLLDDQEVMDHMDRQVVVLTDLQEGCRVSDLQTYEWPEGISVRTERLTSTQVGNASLQWMAEGVREGDLAVFLRIRNAPDSIRERFQVGWAPAEGDGFAGQPQEVYVPAGQSRLISLRSTGSDAGGRAVVLKGDGEPFDNRVFVIPPVRANLSVVYLGEDRDDESPSPLYFLQRALPDTARQEIRVTAVQSDEPLPRRLIQESALIVATHPLQEAVIQEVRTAVEQGGTLLLAAESVACAPTLAGLTGVETVTLTEAAPMQYAMLGDIDFRHPLFSPFADERFSNFTGIHFWKYRRLDESEIPNARVVARFDSEDPALVEVPIGKGQLILLTSGWSLTDSQLALSSKFVPLLFSVLERGGRATLPPNQYFIGDPVDLGPAEPMIVVKASDSLPVDLDPKAAPAFIPRRPGLYTLESPNAERRLAVNLDPRESRTASLSEDELERLGVPVPKTVPNPVRAAQRRINLHNADLEARQKLWQWVILLTLALLLVETWLAGWTRHRGLTTEGVSA